MTDRAVSTVDLTKRYGDVAALDGVQLRVQSGEVYGFLGLNGAGKTTTIRLLLGMIHPTSGYAEIFGVRVGPGAREVWRRVGHLVESAVAYPELTVRENLEHARRLHDLPDRHASDRIIERLGLREHADRRAGVLSLGNLQRLGLAHALMHEPDLVVLDEPANGLDPAGVVEVRELLRSLARERGVTVFMSILSVAVFEPVRAGSREHQWLELSEQRALDHPDEIARLLVEGGVPPTRLAIEQEDIEEHFLRLTSSDAEARP